MLSVAVIMKVQCWDT